MSSSSVFSKWIGYCLCRMPHRKSPQSLHWHPVLHGRAQPNPHLLREVSTGRLLWRLLSACVETLRAVTSFSLFFSGESHRAVQELQGHVQKAERDLQPKGEEPDNVYWHRGLGRFSFQREKRTTVRNVWGAREKVFTLLVYFEQAYKIK